jgi:hypothetical protein
LLQDWKKLTSFGKPALAALLTGLFLLLTTSSGSALIHKHLHAEGSGASHTCVICLLAQGQVDSSVAAPAPGPILIPLIDSVPVAYTVPKQDILLPLSASRAPPVS